jgi:hypothetical protein
MRRSIVKAGNGMMRKTFLLVLAVFSLCVMASPQDQQQAPARAPSTPEERKRFVAIVHKFEQSPLDEGLKSDVDWALNWLQDIPDINVSVCPTPLGNLTQEEYQYRTRLSVLYVLAMGAYLVDHPQKAADTISQYIAGAQSAIKAYKAILKAKPQAKSRSMDELVAKDAEGTLDEFVRDAAKACEDTNQT